MLTYDAFSALIPLVWH